MTSGETMDRVKQNEGRYTNKSSKRAKCLLEERGKNRECFGIKMTQPGGNVRR
jgi:hypothetical protein